LKNQHIFGRISFSKFSVALNYQSQDESTYINLINFRRNKGCGFLLKPKQLFDPTFNPNETTAATIDRTKIVVQVLIV